MPRVEAGAAGGHVRSPATLGPRVAGGRVGKQHCVLHVPWSLSWKSGKGSVGRWELYSCGISFFLIIGIRDLLWKTSFHFRSLINCDRVTGYQVNSREFTLVAEPTASLSAQKRPIQS